MDTDEYPSFVGGSSIDGSGSSNGDGECEDTTSAHADAATFHQQHRASLDPSPPPPAHGYASSSGTMIDQSPPALAHSFQLMSSETPPPPVFLFAGMGGGQQQHQLIHGHHAAHHPHLRHENTIPASSSASPPPPFENAVMAHRYFESVFAMQQPSIVTPLQQHLEQFEQQRLAWEAQAAEEASPPFAFSFALSPSPPVAVTSKVPAAAATLRVQLPPRDSTMPPPDLVLAATSTATLQAAAKAAQHSAEYQRKVNLAAAVIRAAAEANAAHSGATATAQLKPAEAIVVKSEHTSSASSVHSDYMDESTSPPPAAASSASSASASVVASSNTTLSSDSRAHYTKVCSWPGCSARFPKESTLARHVRCHTGERPFACTIGSCTAAFSERGNLVRHEASHADQRRFACPFAGYCTARFRRAAHVEQHVASRHTALGEDVSRAFIYTQPPTSSAAAETDEPTPVKKTRNRQGRKAPARPPPPPRIKGLSSSASPPFVATVIALDTGSNSMLLASPTVPAAAVPAATFAVPKRTRAQRALRGATPSVDAQQAQMAVLVDESLVSPPPAFSSSSAAAADSSRSTSSRLAQLSLRSSTQPCTPPASPLTPLPPQSKRPRRGDLPALPVASSSSASARPRRSAPPQQPSPRMGTTSSFGAFVPSRTSIPHLPSMEQAEDQMKDEDVAS